MTSSLKKTIDVEWVLLWGNAYGWTMFGLGILLGYFMWGK